MIEAKRDFIDKYVFNTTIFKILILIFTFLVQIPFVHFVIGGYVKIALAYGLLVCAWHMISGRMLKSIKNVDSIILIAFLGLYAITIIVNHDYSFKDNFNQWVYMAVFFYILYMSPKAYSRESVLKEINILFGFVLAISFIASLISFTTFMFNIYAAYCDDTAYYYVGVFDNRLWGIYNPNVCALVSSISLLISNAYLLEWDKRKIGTRVFLIINVIIQFSCMVATGSRTALYGFVVIMVLTTGFLAYKKRVDRVGLKRLVSAICASVVCILSLTGAWVMTKTLLPYVPKVTLDVLSLENRTTISIQGGDGEIILPSKNNEVKDLSSSSSNSGSVSGNKNHNSLSTVDEDVDLDRKDVNSVADLTNRNVLWQFGLEQFKKSPILGVSWRGIQDLALRARDNKELSYDLWMNINGGSLHNSYITILVSSGVLGLVAFLAFSVLTAVKYLKYLFGHKSIHIMTLCLCAIVAYFYITELTEARILYLVAYPNVLFWSTLGYASKLMGKDV